jgi:excisionase family DNA binding protein
MATTATEPRLLTAKEVGALLGVSSKHVAWLVREGKLESVRLGGSGWHRFRREDVEAFIRGDSP